MKATSHILWTSVVVAVLGGCTLLRGQIAGNGVIQGTVTDPSGAVVPGATVTATNEATHMKVTTHTTSAGFYVLSPLPPGQYVVTVSDHGFQTLEQAHVVVNALTVLGLNLVLKVGSTTQRVTVTASPPALNTSNGTLGVTIPRQTYLDLPLSMSNAPRNPEQFIYLLPGVSSGSGFVGNINGGIAFSKEIYANGLPLALEGTQGDSRNISQGIPVDAVEQFQVDTNGTPPMYQGQGSENFVIKSGTNQFHGDAFDFLRNDALDARGFFSTNVPTEKQNEFGGSVGGPIKKNKAFFFFSYDGYRLRLATVPTFSSVPTIAERNGDFSALLPSEPIYDPTSTSCSSAGICTRTAFPGNIIPPSMISPVAKSFESYLPTPTNSLLQNNFLQSFPNGTDYNEYLTKEDYNFSNKDHLWGMFDFGKNFSVPAFPAPSNGLPFPYAGSRDVVSNFTIAQLSETHVFSPTVVNDVNLSFNRLWIPILSGTVSGGYPQKAGFKGIPPGFADSAFPEVDFGGPNSPADWAGINALPFNEAANTSVLQDNVQWVKGSHSMTFGTELMWLEDNDWNPDSTLRLAFSNSETAGFGPTGTLLTSTGNSYASFLLGAVDNAGYTKTTVAETGARLRHYAFYALDNWKATRRLTLNLGLRWDLMTPYVEEYNRESFMNPTLPNSAVEGYPGAYEFVGYGPDSCLCRSPIATHWGNFGPRIGFAYRLTDRNVIRGSYNIFYIDAAALGGGINSRQGIDLLGFSAAPTFTSLNAGISPAFYLDSGLPSFAAPPFFNPTLNAGFNTAAPSGGGASFGDPQLGGKPPYMENYNFTMEREVSPSTILNVSYSGSQTHFAPTGIGRGIYSDQILPKYMALGNLLFVPATPANIASAQTIFPGVHLPYANFQGTIGQMLRPFPQYAGVNDVYGDIGNALYNSLQASVQHRFSKGLYFLISYTMSKEIDDSGSNLGGFFGASGRTAYNNKLEKAVGVMDIPNQLVASYVYQLPFGSGHSLSSSSHLVNSLISNWRVSGIQSYIEGEPLGTIGAACDVPYTGGCYANFNPDFTGPARINGSYGSGNLLGSTPPSFINVNAFADPAPFTFGNTPRTLAYDLRAPWSLDEDFSVGRDFTIRENKVLEVRGDVFNALNRVVFGCIQTNITSSSFGQVGCQTNGPRVLQVAAKFTF